MSKHLVFCSTLKQVSDDHQYPDDPLAAVADFKIILEKVRKRTVHELPRKTPSTPGAKLLTASTALRAYRNRHLGTLMHCCEAWEPVGKFFDQNSFECTDFHGLSQIIASLTRERIAEREAEIGNFPWTQTDIAMAKSQFLFNAYKHVLEGGTIPALCTESRTVFIAKFSDIDNDGRIVRSPEALRPLTLCN